MPMKITLSLMMFTFVSLMLFSFIQLLKVLARTIHFLLPFLMNMTFGSLEYGMSLKSGGKIVNVILVQMIYIWQMSVKGSKEEESWNVNSSLVTCVKIVDCLNGIMKKMTTGISSQKIIMDVVSRDLPISHAYTD